MRFSVPRVDSEAFSVQPPRAPLPSSRTYSSADSRDSTPFADLLDTQAPVAEKPPAPPTARSERPEPPDRADQPKPADDRNAGATTAKDKTDSKDVPDAKDAQGAQDSKDATDAKTATDSSGDAKSAKDAKDGKAAGATTDAKDAKAVGDKPKSDADQTAALDAMFVNAATPTVTAPQVVVVAVTLPPVLADAKPEAGTPEAEALAALQAAAGQGPRVAPDATTKPGQKQTGDKPADATTKGVATAGPQAAVPEIEAGKNGETHSTGSNNSSGSGDKAFGEFHRAAAELLSKVDMNAPVQSGGAAASAVQPTADAMQNLGVTAPANATNPATAAATAAVSLQTQAQPPAVAVPLSGLAVEIVTQADAGRNHFEIRLDPPDLGRINVKLHVDNDGNVTTHLVVDRPETLDLLKRDAASLERALQQAGLKTSDHGLDFSLRQHSFTQDDKPAQTGSEHMIVPDDDPAPLEALRQGYGRLLGLGGGLDIRI
jgi:flagellar hook-length control protein FliK